MTHPPATRIGLILGTLLLGTFVVGSAELLAAGLLPLISSGLDVSKATAGTLVGANAIGLALGGPLLTVATLRRDRRQVLIASMLLFAVLTVSPAVVPDYGWFLVARVVGGALQGLFMGAAFTTATAIAAPEQSGRAVSVVIAGFSVATVVGQPMGVLAGSLVGWRGTLALFAAAALVLTGLLAAVAPRVPSTAGSGSALRHVAMARVLAVLALSFVLFAAPGAVLSYLMPLLHEVVGHAGAVVGLVLVGYGVASVVGTLLGGRLADANSARGLIISCAGIGLSLLTLVLIHEFALVAVVAVLSWGVFFASASPSIQHRVVGLAGPGGPLVASLPASAANAGIAVGSGIGAIVFAHAGVLAVVAFGAAVAAGALALATATRRLQPPEPEAQPAPVPTLTSS